MKTTRQLNVFTGTGKSEHWLCTRIVLRLLHMTGIGFLTDSPSAPFHCRWNRKYFCPIWIPLMDCLVCLLTVCRMDGGVCWWIG